jgi:hypothetical protein
VNAPAFADRLVIGSVRVDDWERLPWLADAPDRQPKSRRRTSFRASLIAFYMVLAAVSYSAGSMSDENESHSPARAANVLSAAQSKVLAVRFISAYSAVPLGRRKPNAPF